jgi:hypothetical protein
LRCWPSLLPWTHYTARKMEVEGLDRHPSDCLILARNTSVNLLRKA